MMYLVAFLMFVTLATISWFAERHHAKIGKASQDSYDQYLAYKRANQYNFLKNCWFLTSFVILVMYMINSLGY
jgi:hypothetical protein